MTPDKDLAARLAELAKSKEFGDVWRFRWELETAYRSGDFITRAEADAMVAAAEKRIWADADETIAAMREQFASGNARFCAGVEPEYPPNAQPAPAKGGE